MQKNTSIPRSTASGPSAAPGAVTSRSTTGPSTPAALASSATGPDVLRVREANRLPHRASEAILKMNVMTDERPDNDLILVADDDEHIVELVSMYLRGAGYRVEAAYDGEETLPPGNEAPPPPPAPA